jgi:putative hydrolase of the HAD superfamily
VSTSQPAGPAPIEAVLFDFGGVLTSSPFETFARYEAANGLPDGFIRSVNATNHHDNAWARFERSEIGFDEFCDSFESEALDAGGRLDTRGLFAALSMSLRPTMIEAVRRCRALFKTGLLTNNFVSPGAKAPVGATRGSGDDRGKTLGEVLDLFDVVVESSVIGVRKPDPRFYLLACEQLGIGPERAVFLDDLGINLKAARQLGMVTIKVGDPYEAIAELESVVGLKLRAGD